MTPHPLNLLLAVEDLTAEERLRLDSHLAECPECRALLERFARVERGMETRGVLPPLERADVFALSEVAISRADASLEALLARLAATHPPALAAERPDVAPRAARSVLGMPRWRQLLRWTPAIAAAAAAVWIAIVRVQPGEPPAPRSLAVMPTESVRGDGPAWRTGDSFVLEFELDAAGEVAVLVLGTDGGLALVHPGPAEARPARLAAGRHRLPDAASGREWRLTEPTGRERFYLVVLRKRHAKLADVLAEAGPPRASDDRDARALRVSTLLRERLGAVREVEIEHLP